VRPLVDPEVAAAEQAALIADIMRHHIPHLPAAATVAVGPTSGSGVLNAAIAAAVHEAAAGAATMSIPAAGAAAVPRVLLQRNEVRDGPSQLLLLLSCGLFAATLLMIFDWLYRGHVTLWDGTYGLEDDDDDDNDGDAAGLLEVLDPSED
jgi:hypothetical protein